MTIVDFSKLFGTKKDAEKEKRATKAISQTMAEREEEIEKRRALMRDVLEETQTNLERLDNVLVEIRTKKKGTKNGA